jgi:type II secretory ATPase GspE/PulE/Tfp pilus assembly ATPase PilB-like protein
VEPYLLASTLSLVVAQRLARRICAGCRTSVDPDPALLDRIRQRPDFESLVGVLQREGVLGADGGSAGRAAALPGWGMPAVSGDRLSRAAGGLRAARGQRPDPRDDHGPQRRRRHRVGALANGIKTMLEDCLAKAFLGEITIEEVFRVAL